MGGVTPHPHIFYTGLPVLFGIMWGLNFLQRRRLDEAESEITYIKEKIKTLNAKQAAFERRLAQIEAETELVEVEPKDEDEEDGAVR